MNVTPAQIRRTNRLLTAGTWFLIVGVVAGVTVLYAIARRNGRDFSARSLGRATGQGPRSRSGSARPKPR